jgi:hypothetical protein
MFDKHSVLAARSSSPAPPPRRPRLWASALGLLGALVVCTATVADGYAAGRSKATKTSPRVAKGAAADATANSSGGSAAGAASALIAAVRADLAAAERGGGGRFANLLVASVVEGAFTSLLHATYALSSTGQALRSGGTAPAEAAVFARDVSRNLGALALTWTALARERAFAGPPAAVFGSLATQAGRGVQAAAALEAWAKAPKTSANAAAFERDLDALRAGVVEVAAALRGPEPQRADPAPPGAPPLPSP